MNRVRNKRHRPTCPVNNGVSAASFAATGLGVLTGHVYDKV